jgi:hypothetical protein
LVAIPRKIPAICNELFFYLQFKTVIVRSVFPIITDLKINRHETTILAIALYGCDTCPVVLRDEQPQTSENCISGLQEVETRGVFMTLHKKVPPESYRVLGFIRVVNYNRLRSSSLGSDKNFLHVVQTGSGVHAVSYPMGTGDSFPGG